MMTVGRLRQMVQDRGRELPWWVSEGLLEALDRIEELEGQVVGLTDENEAMYGVLKLYAVEVNGERAQVFIDR